MNQQTIKVQQHADGVGFAGALFLVFLVLKLLGIINWSWWWVSYAGRRRRR